MVKKKKEQTFAWWGLCISSLITIGLIVLIVKLVFFGWGLAGWYDDTNPFDDCYYETNILHKQEVRDDKLYMVVEGDYFKRGKCGHVFWEGKGNRTLYFSGENKLKEDIKVNDSIRIRWCWISKISADRIRGIE